MTYRLFISHSWSYSDKYDGLIKLLNGAHNFEYFNHSVPKNDPVHSKTDRELKEAIEAKMRGVSCVLILAGVYATYSKWINIEIEIANDMNKPIIAIEYWGSERTSRTVKDNADKIVKWQTTSIVKAIQELCR
ncbi:TIR domain-containing protein [Geovibrio ferrireducens]|uniref:TIR domain-containing protein n=1 Tax=Geovibrio ferrireducens TaxID=46201 RepID=UPI0022480159|nr:TIR domain-containing protein [Geovibrio ferrireducens]